MKVQIELEADELVAVAQAMRLFFAPPPAGEGVATAFALQGMIATQPTLRPSLPGKGAQVPAVGELPAPAPVAKRKGGRKPGPKPTLRPLRQAQGPAVAEAIRSRGSWFGS